MLRARTLRRHASFGPLRQAEAPARAGWRNTWRQRGEALKRDTLVVEALEMGDVSTRARRGRRRGETLKGDVLLTFEPDHSSRFGDPDSVDRVV